MRDHISVCICTFHRNRMLERLLRSLAALETRGLFDFSVVVVDNDTAEHAKETVIRLTSELDLEITFGIEPERTIPAARNRALQFARGNYIAIIDDDEFAPQHWLVTMYSAIRMFDVDGALGPVYPFFEEKPPDWLIKGKFCERPVYHTGTLLDWSQTRTGNVLLKREVFDRHQLRFDLKWKTSGSDRAFFKQAMEWGYRFVAVAEAPVYECVPRARWTQSYYLKRALVHGFNSHRYSNGDLRGFSWIAIALRSVFALIIYSLCLPAAALLGKHRFVSCLEKGGHHLSRLLAMFGIEIIKKRDF
jgi:succinoglycan biosynthesis protein ExoM